MENIEKVRSFSELEGISKDRKELIEKLICEDFNEEIDIVIAKTEYKALQEIQIVNSVLLNIKISNIENIILKETKIIDTLNIESKEIKKIEFMKCILYHHASLKMEVQSINTMVFNDVKSYSKELIIENITVNEFLNISKIDSNICFKNIDLSLCKNITFRDILSIKNMFINITWGEIRQYRINGSTNTFRELKYLAEHTKNFIDSAKFNALEMSNKLNDMRKERNGKGILDKISFYLSYEFILEIYELFSNYGASWLKPLSYFIFSALLYDIYIFKEVRYVFFYLLVMIPIIYIPIIVQRLSKVDDNYYYYIVLPKLKIVLFVILLLSYICILTSNEEFYLKSLADIVNPFEILKGDKKSISELSFWALIFKFYLLFLMYQIGLAIRKLVRSK